MRSTAKGSSAWLVAALIGCGGTTTVDDGAGGASAGPGAGPGSGNATNGSAGPATSGAGGNASFGKCTGPGQCILAEPGCCGSCGRIGLDDVEPIHQDQQKAFYAATCDDPTGPCPGCASLPNPDLFAFCDAGQCAEADITKHAANVCKTSQDCRLRIGLACCEACVGSREQVVAIPVAFEKELLALVCGGDVGCPACAPQYPPYAVAACEGGRCVVSLVDPPPP
jgi:hypothetical protein